MTYKRQQAQISGLERFIQYVMRELDRISAAFETEVAQPIDQLQFTVIEADADYQVLLYDDAINCDGTFDVTLIDIADAVDPIIVTSTNGTVSILADATIQGSASVSTGTSAEWYPARGQWWLR